MPDKFLQFLVMAPICAGLLALGIPRRLKGFFALLASFAVLAASFLIFGKESSLKLGEIGFGIALNFRLYHFSSFIVAAVSAFTFFSALYCLSFFNKNNNPRQFHAYLLLSLGFTNGAVLADNLVAMLFFWEGLLLVLFALISQSGSNAAFKTAIKAFVIVGISDLCMMAGIALTGRLAGTLNITEINLMPQGLAGIAFILLVIGAISKAGAMPFHTWIPDAAVDAPLPFMAYFPAALEKLLGIYFLSRICLDLFKLQAGSGLSVLLMSLGAITIILAVMMALVQKDYKRLLSYHAISQVGYMILGIGTALPVGIVGGLFHMLNNALYKSCLFFTAGAVEKETGTTDLAKLGGLFRKMPFTFISFSIAAVSISGMPPFNGFFSKELIYDAALERGMIFYLAALVGSFFTAASFLKLGSAAFLGQSRQEHKEVREARPTMLIPMITLALICILFGIFNNLAIKKFFQPVLLGGLQSNHFFDFHTNITLVVITLLVLLGAFIHHLIGVKINGSGLKAVDHIYHFAPFHKIYVWQEKKYFDPYEIAIKLGRRISDLLWRIDRMIDWVYDSLVTGLVYTFSRTIHRLHSGYYVVYLIWALAGAFLVMLFAFK
ncbi:MAG: proton-conducting transporter membrane subunit [Candidatus Omnitrophica bacterium]|nr:proton-conducting transporter membrane subunit [Candidatus Omnitrophota bacterium]